MSFQSILFEGPDTGAGEPQEPGCFRDLNLDQIVKSIIAGREEYALAPLFRAPLQRVEAVRYRHEVFRDLEDPALAARIASFAAAMRTVRARLAESEKLRHVLQRERWFLDAMSLYGEAVARLEGELRESALRSRGLAGFRDYLAAYVHSERFAGMREEARTLIAALAAIRYDLFIEGTRIEVRPHEGAPDYGVEVSKTFAKFEQGAVRDRRFGFRDYPEMNHVESAILERVSLLFPEAFAQLEAFCERRRDALDATIRRFDREAQFYLACREHVARTRSAGVEFCYPDVTDSSKALRAVGMFDLALAGKLLAERKRVVTNDFFLEGRERILVVSGANQGGKTTFARAFGQLHWLGALGCPVPAREARLFLFDGLYTHFEREEAVETLTGKLEEELLRMRRILAAATSHSILIMNESFGSTTLEDALYLGRAVLRQVIAKDMVGVCVTFLDELASLDPATVSMVSGVEPSDPAVRTFKIERRAADGLAYALAIARKYRLTYGEVKERVRR